MNFDELYRIGDENDGIEYGCVVGDHKIVYIKVGMGGSYVGYEEKYLRMAHDLRDTYGCSVICVSNPLPHGRSIASDLAIMEDFTKRHNLQGAEMYFFGVSNGGMKGLEMTAVGAVFKKMVLVNMPLMQNFHRNAERIKSIGETRVVAVYGEQDPSYPYVAFLENKRLPNVEIIKVPGVDHNFKGAMDVFFALAHKLFE